MRRDPEAAFGPLVLAMALVLGGCAASIGRSSDPGRLAAEILALSDSTPGAGWTATGRIQWLVDGRSGRGRVRMLLGDEGRVRVDIEPSGAFGLGGGRATLWADRDHVLWQERGEAPRPIDADQIFAPILGERATGGDLELLLLGLSRLGARWPPPPWTVAPESSELNLEAIFPDGSMEEAHVTGDPLVMKRLIRRNPGGKVLFRARFDHFRAVDATPVAGRVDLEAPGEGNTLRVDWDQVTWGKVTPADLAWPDGYSSSRLR